MLGLHESYRRSANFVFSAEGHDKLQSITCDHSDVVEFKSQFQTETSNAEAAVEQTATADSSHPVTRAATGRVLQQFKTLSRIKANFHGAR
jgi:hypothetical protein